MRWRTWKGHCLGSLVGVGELRRPDAALRRPYLIALQTARLVEHKIRQPTPAIANKSPRPGIDEIREENAVARLNLIANRVRRMPSVVRYGERVSCIRRKRHLCLLWFPSVRQHFVKDRAD